MQETAYAKINLALHVRAREPDGYHRIETLFAFCEDGDLLTALDADRLSLVVTGPFAGALEGESDNLVLRAARSLGRAAALTLDKRLPVAAGIGGGSADAAATLRLLARGSDVTALAAALGADVPACLLSRTAWGEGKGDRVRPVDIPALAGTPILLVNPNIPLATADVFAAWDGIDRGPLGGWQDGRNDLQRPATGLVPEIADVLEALSGARVARMSGSGATCFGIYASMSGRDAAAAAIAGAHPGWWMLATRLR
jgi:4-diphosphocytidyl-2-C-methyl-D-erythritol kinase